MKARKISAAIAVTALGLSGCSSSPSPPAKTSSFALPSAAAAALAPAIYMQLASTSSLFAIRASELAVQRASSGRVRETARAIITDQGGVGSQLSYAGRRVDLLPTAALTDAQAADLERLRTTGDFDSEYRRIVGGVLAQSLQAHQAFARAGTSPTLRPVAQMAAPVTKRNLDAVRR
ncbi:MAG: DUF4142 domain-containing protein [Sphingomicrobium sp.]